MVMILEVVIVVYFVKGMIEDVLWVKLLIMFNYFFGCVFYMFGLVSFVFGIGFFLVDVVLLNKV